MSTFLVVEIGNSSTRFVDGEYVDGRRYTLNRLLFLNDFPNTLRNVQYQDSELFRLSRKAKPDYDADAFDQIFMVGEQAAYSLDSVTKIGIDKFVDYQYYSAFIASALIYTYPDGCDDVTLAVTHPFDYNIDIKDKIANLAVGKYYVTTKSGKRLVYTVRNVSAYNETEGAIAYLMKVNNNGVSRFRVLLPNIKNNQIVRLVDWGYGTLQLIDMQVQGELLHPIEQSIRTFEFGGFVYADMLSKYIASTYKDQLKLRGDRVPYDAKLFDAILTGKYELFGNHAVSVDDENVRIKNIAGSQFSGIMTEVPYNHLTAILWSGGSSLFYAETANRFAFPVGFIWNASSKLISDNIDILRFSNILGIRAEMLSRKG